MKTKIALAILVPVLFLFAVVIGRTGPQVSASSLPLKIALNSPSPEWTAGEPGFINITWINTGKTPITLAEGLWYPTNRRARFKVTGPASRDCIVFTGPLVYSKPFPHEDLNSGEERNWTFRLSNMGIVAEGSYELWMEYDTTSLEASWDPIHPFRGMVSSNHVKVEILPPSGVDAQALEKLGDSCKRMPDIGGLNWKKLLSDYPDSVYTAWAISSRIGAPDQLPPGKMKQLIDTGFYPSASSVPDAASPDGWRSLKGNDLSRWIIDWANRILQAHPHFVYADRLKLNIALNNLAIGDRDNGLKDLEAIAQKDNGNEAKWAKEFRVLLK
jgi:hypothetical protein